MKKLFLLLTMLLLASCYTSTVNQTHLYGTVKNVSYYKGCYHTEVWCSSKEKFYTILTNDMAYNIGDVILIK